MLPAWSFTNRPAEGVAGNAAAGHGDHTPVLLRRFAVLRKPHLELGDVLLLLRDALLRHIARLFVLALATAIFDMAIAPR